jgi:hypothetical protein
MDLFHGQNIVRVEFTSQEFRKTPCAIQVLLIRLCTSKVNTGKVITLEFLKDDWTLISSLQSYVAKHSSLAPSLN